MTTFQSFKLSAVTLACIGMLIPTACVSAEEPVRLVAPPTNVDVTLTADGELRGLVVDAAGHPQANLPVHVHQTDKHVASVVSDEHGKFEFSLATGGTYLIAAGDNVTVMRCWSHGTAPPQASEQLVVNAAQVTRGQISPATSALANPWVITGLAITAVVIPVALHNARDDRNNGS